MPCEAIPARAHIRSRTPTRRRRRLICPRLARGRRHLLSHATARCRTSDPRRPAPPRRITLQLQVRLRCRKTAPFFFSTLSSDSSSFALAAPEFLLAALRAGLIACITQLYTTKTAFVPTHTRRSRLTTPTLIPIRHTHTRGTRTSATHDTMAVMSTAGTERARFLLNGIPDRFNDFCHMDQITFVQLADWLLEHAECNIPREISIEECLFVFLDIVAQGNSFKAAAYGWDHDVQLTQRYVGSRQVETRHMEMKC
jgi:hypothetical protein